MHSFSMHLFARSFVVHFAAEVKSRSKMSLTRHESGHNDLNIKLHLPWSSVRPAIWLLTSFGRFHPPPQKSCELNAELHVPDFAWSPWETVPVAEILQLRRKVGVLSFLWKASITRSCELVPRSYLNEPVQVVTQSFQLRYIVWYISIYLTTLWSMSGVSVRGRQLSVI